MSCALVTTLECFLTFIVLDLGRDRLRRLSVANLVHGLDTELVLHVLRQVLDGATALREDLAVGHIKLVAVGSHLLHVVSSDGAAAVAAGRLPGQCDGRLASAGVVELLGGRGSACRATTRDGRQRFV